jgi:hypothetical protein
MPVSKNQGSFLLNTFRVGMGTNNVQITLVNPAGPAPYRVHLYAFMNSDPVSDPTEFDPAIMRFSPSTGLTCTDGFATRDVLIANTDNFGLPDDYEDLLPIFIGIGQIQGLDEFILIASRNRPVRGGVATTVTATDDDSTLGQSVQTIDRIIWVGAFVGQTRSSGLWDWSNAKFLDGTMI